MTQRTWEPLWESFYWTDPHRIKGEPPFSIRPWAFSAQMGIPYPLECRILPTKKSDGSIDPNGWRVDEDTAPIRNPANDIRVSWLDIQNAVRTSRTKKISLKDAFAEILNLDDPRITPEQWQKFALAPDVTVADVRGADGGPDPAAQKKAAEAYLALKKKAKSAPAAAAKE